MHNFKTRITQKDKIACFVSWRREYLKKYLKELLNLIDMHSQYVGVCNDLPSKNLVNQRNYTFFTKKKIIKKIIFFTIIKKLCHLCLQW